MKNVFFQEYAPLPGLRDFVQAYWTAEFNLQNLPDWSQIVVPNGYAEVIIHLSAQHCCLTRSRQWEPSAAYTVLGLFTRPYTVRFHARVKVFGIRFHPEGLHQVFGVPAAVVLEQHESVSNVLGEEFSDFCERLNGSGDVHQQVVAADLFLSQCLARNFRSYDVVSQAARMIRKESHRKMETIQKTIPISSRQLQRSFKARLGLSPKTYLRLARMSAIQQYLMGVDKADFNALTYAHGFSDPSHLTKEFQQLIGRAPTKFVQHREEFIVNPKAGDHDGPRPRITPPQI